jgi:hypothetical protein
MSQLFLLFLSSSVLLIRLSLSRTHITTTRCRRTSSVEEWGKEEKRKRERKEVGERGSRRERIPKREKRREREKERERGRERERKEKEREREREGRERAMEIQRRYSSREIEKRENDRLRLKHKLILSLLLFSFSSSDPSSQHIRKVMPLNQLSRHNSAEFPTSYGTAPQPPTQQQVEEERKREKEREREKREKGKRQRDTHMKGEACLRCLCEVWRWAASRQRHVQTEESENDLSDLFSSLSPPSNTTSLSTASILLRL